MKMTYTEMFALVRDGSMSFAAFVDAMGVLVVEEYEAGLREGSREPANYDNEDAFELDSDYDITENPQVFGNDAESDEESDLQSDERYRLGWADGYDDGIAYAKDLYDIKD